LINKPSIRTLINNDNQPRENRRRNMLFPLVASSLNDVDDWLDRASQPHNIFAKHHQSCVTGEDSGLDTSDSIASIFVGVNKGDGSHFVAGRVCR
jgi:hypothetical protein